MRITPQLLAQYNSDSHSTHPNVVTLSSRPSHPNSSPCGFVECYSAQQVSIPIWDLPGFCLVRESQPVLHVVGNPLCKLGGQPLEDRIVLGLGILEPQQLWVWLGHVLLSWKCWSSLAARAAYILHGFRRSSSSFTGQLRL